MSLLTLRNVSLSYGHPPLLDDVSLEIGSGERICLIGRNGAGKSTLMKIVAGELAPDEGHIQRAPGLRVARLEQEVPRESQGTVFDQVADGLGELADRVKQYHRACAAVAGGDDPRALARLSEVQQAMEAAGGWQREQRVAEVISRLSLDSEALFETLSGGLKRRVLLARALVSDPDLLLLDEPTNHLDIESITWLETFLAGWRGSLLFVTHDRAFVRRLATRIVELDRGRLNDWPGDYAQYLKRRAEQAQAEARARARQDRLLEQEEAWIRQGIQARRTRNEGRVRRLQALREAVRQRREGPGRARLEIDSGERSGRLVCRAEGVCYAWQGRVVVRDFDLVIQRGERVGLIGPNGCGKTTLLNLLLGRLEPQQGRIRLGTGLQVAHFDQLRSRLDPGATVLDSVAGGRERIDVGGRSRHVMSYLQDFLFSPARARQPVRALSGGERNRLLLAQLFTQPANLLVLDEPTNDLDVETLELLEERLLEFDGTLLLVSHDRAFLDNVVTSVLVFEGEGRVRSFVGGYRDWAARQTVASAPPKATRPASPAAPVRRRTRAARLSYREQQALEQLPQEIERLEAEQAELETWLSDPERFRTDPEGARRATERLGTLVTELEARYARWEELEARREALERA